MLFRSLLALAAVGASVEAYCFDTGYNMCLNWTSDGTSITFEAQCTPENGILGWCAFGISADGSGNMVPAEAWMLTVDNSTGSIYLEDRAITSYAAPPCMPTQVSTLVSASVSAASGVLTATWERALVVSADLQAEGYVSIVDGWMEAISATMSAPTGTPATHCSPTMIQHDDHSERIPINFFNPPPGPIYNTTRRRFTKA